MKNYHVKVKYAPNIALEILEHEFQFTVTYELSFTKFNVMYCFRDISELKKLVMRQLSRSEDVLKSDLTSDTETVIKNLRKMLRKL